MTNGYQMFEKLHPPGSLYRYKAVFDTHDGWKSGKVYLLTKSLYRYKAVFDTHDGWKSGKVYLLTKWEVPEGLSKKSPLRNAFFLVDGKERCVDISFFRYLEQVE